MTSVVLASSNQGKLRELNTALNYLGVEFTPQSTLNIDDAVEDGLSFVENAIIKARHAARLSGLPALADDSGLSVDALGGAPGIYSARYSGSRDDRDNYLKLLNELHDKDNRVAQFNCCLVLVRHWQDPTPLICQGVWSGNILHAPQGDGGFGYDPVFQPTGLDISAAELSKEQKSKISHRGKAVEQLLSALSVRPNWLS
jgi:XTP/dITP diphosphohydrolase